MLWNLECPVGLSKKKKVRISMKEIGCNLDGEPKGEKELRNVLEGRKCFI